MTSGPALLMALFIALQGTVAASAVDAPTANVRLDLRGAGECISRTELTSGVLARSRRILFVEDASIHARVSLTSGRPGNVVAELVLAGPGNEPPPRRFVARSCAEVADAIALIIAVTLDPTVTVGEPGANEVSAPANEPAAEPARPARPPATTASVAASPSARATRRFGAVVACQTLVGAAPGVMPGIALYGMAAVDRDGPWAPALLVGGTHVWRNDLSEPGGAASFKLDAASLDVCPVRTGRPRFVARPCASVLVGRLSASGTNTDRGMSAARPFASAGVAFMASVGSKVELFARVALGVTLLRDSYEFGRMIFYRASLITGGANLGVGFQWP